MLKTQLFRNLVLPIKLTIASWAEPGYVRFAKDRKLLISTRVLLIGFYYRLFALTSLLIHLLLGHKVSYYLIFVAVVLLGANLFSNFALYIGTSLRALLSKAFFRSDDYESIIHPFAIGYVAILIPLWVLPGYLGNSIYAFRIVIEVFFARKGSSMSFPKIFVIFLLFRIGVLTISLLMKKLGIVG